MFRCKHSRADLTGSESLCHTATSLSLNPCRQLRFQACVTSLSTTKRSSHILITSAQQDLTTVLAKSHTYKYKRAAQSCDGQQQTQNCLLGLLDRSRLSIGSSRLREDKGLVAFSHLVGNCVWVVSVCQFSCPHTHTRRPSNVSLSGLPLTLSRSRASHKCPPKAAHFRAMPVHAHT